jgi:hypothetical protein
LIACSSQAPPAPPVQRFSVVCSPDDAGAECSCSYTGWVVKPKSVTCDAPSFPATRCCADEGYPLLGGCSCSGENARLCWSYTQKSDGKKYCLCMILGPPSDPGWIVDPTPQDTCTGTTCCESSALNDCSCYPYAADCSLTKSTKVATCASKTTCLLSTAKPVSSCSDPSDGG